MAFYRDHVLPHLIRVTMQSQNFTPYRERVLATATGRVLDIGIGAGANLSFYQTGVCEIVGLEPSARLATMARQAAERVELPVTVIEAGAEKIPLDDHSVDSVVMTWTLCSIADPAAALAEMRRVLKPQGRLLFVEHGLAPDAWVRTVQRRLTPLWKHLAGGCHLDCAMDSLIQNAGFRVEHLATGYMRGPRLMAFMYEGRALPA